MDIDDEAQSTAEYDPTALPEQPGRETAGSESAQPDASFHPPARERDGEGEGDSDEAALEDVRLDASPTEANPPLPIPSPPLPDSPAQAVAPPSPPAISPSPSPSPSLASASNPIADTEIPLTTSPPPSVIPSPASADEDKPEPGAKVYGVALVGFHHAVGPTVEFCYPEELNHNSQLLSEHLPFFALPDGAHAREEDYSYFHLLLPAVAEGTIFGISCNRQIQSDELVNKGKDVTRSTVQKAIVVLASKPIFGPLRDKLGVITRAYFAQKDFDDKSILVDLYSSLEIPSEPGVGPSGSEDDGEMYMGTSLRELVHKFRFKTLMLLKLLLLQRRVMFFAAHTPIESLCTFQYSLVALIPALLMHLEDAASPTLDERSKHIVKPTSLRTSDKHSLIRYLGLPLNIFGKDSFFQPYLPLQQIDMLKTRSFLVGTSNSIFQQQRDCQIDVIVNIETASLEILNPKLVPFITLTAADRKWMDEIVFTVDGSWNAADPSRPLGGNFIGSDDFIRAKFEEYICSLFASIKFSDFLAKGERGDVLISGADTDYNMMTSFNERFIDAFKATPAFELWDRTTDSVIFDLVEPKHPMEGKTNPIEDVGIRLAHGLHDLHLEDNFAPTREAITRGLTSGSDSLWKTYSFLRSDIGKRQTEFRERREKEGLGHSLLAGGTSATPLITNTVFAGVDVAKTGAVTLATGIGSFLSSSKLSLWARNPTPPTPASPVEPPSPTTFPRRSLTPTPPASEARYPPIARANSTPASSSDASPPTGFPAFFRPLSTSSLASSPTLNAPSTPVPAAGFFSSFRNKTQVEVAPAPAPEMEGEFRVRDLDAEYAAKIARRRASAISCGGGRGGGGARSEGSGASVRSGTSVGGGSDDGYEVVSKPGAKRLSPPVMERDVSAGGGGEVDRDEDHTLLGVSGR